MCEQCDEMLGPMRRLEKKLGTKILKYEVWNDPAAYKLMQFLDKTPAGRSQCAGCPSSTTGRRAPSSAARRRRRTRGLGRGPQARRRAHAPPPPDQIKVQGRHGAKARQQRVANEKKRKAVEDMRDRQLEPGAAAGREQAPANPRRPRPLPSAATGGDGAVTRAQRAGRSRVLRSGAGTR
ncbi:hypothetical protein JL721_7531 [Aureococcus anophagefferens]|nr:hypothetical protein JL721_7531 [Aureococcus anophagefferens]